MSAAEMQSGARVVDDLSLSQSTGRMGTAKTPPEIFRVIRAADGGDVSGLVDLINECRQRDAHLHACQAIAEQSVAAVDWTLSAPENATATEAAATAWATQALRSLPIRSLVTRLAGAVLYGFACVEIVWGKVGGKLVPIDFVFVAPRRFKFDRDTGKLVLADLGEEPIDLAKKYPDKFIFSFPHVTGDVPCREGLGRILVVLSTARNWTIGDYLKAAELSFKPRRIGTYSKAHAAADDRLDLETIMRRMTTDLSCVIPDSTSIAFEWPGGASAGRSQSQHAELAKVLAGEVSKAILGSTETVESSTSSGYAQAKVHNEVRRDLRDGRARQIAADISRDLVAKLIVLNFGPSVRAPTFEFDLTEATDLEAFSKAAKNLIDAGLPLPAAWLRDMLGAPTPKPGEEVIGAATPK